MLYMAKKSINDLLDNSNIAQKLKEAYTFMLLSKGYSANEIKILDDYVFIVRKKDVGRSIKSDDTEYYDDSTLRNRKERSTPKNLVCLTSNNEVYNKKDHIKKMQLRGMQKNFSWDTSAQNYVGVYSDALWRGCGINTADWK